jgi:glycosyltransferase involved in cell wall biosynthesis
MLVLHWNMKICIDATPLLLRSVGVKTYIYHWLDHLLRASNEETIVAFPWIRQLGSLNHDTSQLGFFSTSVRIALLRCANHRLPLALKLLMPEADLFHVSNQLREPPTNLRLSATIHDFTTWLFPELHTQANLQADKHFAEAVLKRASALIAVSENTRVDAVRVLGLNPNRIEVIYPGVSDSYFAAVPRPSQRFPRPYILFVGTIEPRKNLALLLEAYELLSTSVREGFDLVIVGPPGWKSEATLARLQAPPRGVRYLGYVPECEMPALVAGATTLACPSLYEGFGFPVAEAMACGVPVVTSAVSSLPEIAGEGALFVDPRSVSDIRSALETVLSTPTLRQKLGQSGARRAQQLFRWSTCAQHSLKFFRKVIGN